MDRLSVGSRTLHPIEPVPPENHSNFTPVYARQPADLKSCPVNVVYKTWVPDKSRIRSEASNPRTNGVNLYGNKYPHTIRPYGVPRPPGEPERYPTVYNNVPQNTLYGLDTRLSYGFGKYPFRAENGKEILPTHYQVKVYPFTERWVYEKRDYGDGIVPSPDIRNWTKHYPVRPGRDF